MTHKTNDQGSVDEASILGILESMDSQVAHRAPGVDWENAFGVRRRGSSDVAKFLAERVRPTMVNAHYKVLETRVLLITSDVAVADTYWHLTGQTKGQGGPELPERKGRTTFVLRKETGKWIIVVQRVADLRVSP